ncbi:MAG TPA: GntR family transcriptional regulator, partial [Acidimicrobiales bacterium]|nr:GntR family transcriptional regulator [Acidimicrobiales bacterium]
SRPPGVPARLDRLSPTPLWAQLAQHLRQQLAGNEFGDRLPTEKQLTRTYGVSRHTVRAALRELEDDGLVVRRAGSGTQVAAQRLEQPLQGLYRLAHTFREQAGDERSELVARATVPAGRVGERLGLPADARLVAIERLRFAGGEPIAVDRSWLPLSVGKPLLAADLRHGSLYDLLAEHAGVRVTGGWERIWPVNPSPEERRLLRLARPHAALAIERLALAGELRIEWRETRIRGDRFCLRAEWDASPRHE